MSAEPLGIFFSQGKQLNYRKGETILSPYDTTANLFYLNQGYVKHYSINENGNEKCYMFYSPGQIFYLLPKTSTLIKDNFFMAMTDVQMYRIAISTLKEFLFNKPDFASEFIDMLLNSLTNFINRIDNLQITDAHSRIVTRLLTLAETFGSKSGDKITILIPITHKDLASTINTTRETVSRELELLEKKKIISCNGKQITCNDIEKLQNELRQNKNY